MAEQSRVSRTKLGKATAAGMRGSREIATYLRGYEGEGFGE